MDTASQTKAVVYSEAAATSVDTQLQDTDLALAAHVKMLRKLKA